MEKGEDMGTYELVATNDRHDAQRLDPILLRLKIHKARLMLLVVVSKDNVRVHKGVQLFDPGLIPCQRVSEGGLRLPVADRVASAIISWTLLVSIAVDVHVGQLAFGAFDVDDPGIGEVVATIGNCSRLISANI